MTPTKLDSIPLSETTGFRPAAQCSAPYRPHRIAMAPTGDSIACGCVDISDANRCRETRRARLLSHDILLVTRVDATTACYNGASRLKRCYAAFKAQVEGTPSKRSAGLIGVIGERHVNGV